MDGSQVSKSITGISHSGFYVDDLDRTLEFYTKLLGAAWPGATTNRPTR